MKIIKQELKLEKANAQTKKIDNTSNSIIDKILGNLKLKTK